MKQRGPPRKWEENHQQLKHDGVQVTKNDKKVKNRTRTIDEKVGSTRCRVLNGFQCLKVFVFRRGR